MRPRASQKVSFHVKRLACEPSEVREDAGCGRSPHPASSLTLSTEGASIQSTQRLLRSPVIRPDQHLIQGKRFFPSASHSRPTGGAASLAGAPDFLFRKGVLT